MLRHRGHALGASCLGQLSHAAPHGSCPARTRGEATGRRPCVSRLDPADSADNKQYLPKNASSHLLQEKLSFCEPANMHDFKDELQVTKSNFCCTARLPALPHRACRIESDTLSNPGPNLAVAREPCPSSTEVLRPCSFLGVPPVDSTPLHGNVAASCPETTALSQLVRSAGTSTAKVPSQSSHMPTPVRHQHLPPSLGPTGAHYERNSAPSQRNSRAHVTLSGADGPGTRTAEIGRDYAHALHCLRRGLPPPHKEKARLVEHCRMRGGCGDLGGHTRASCANFAATSARPAGAATCVDASHGSTCCSGDAN